MTLKFNSLILLLYEVVQNLNLNIDCYVKYRINNYVEGKSL